MILGIVIVAFPGYFGTYLSGDKRGLTYIHRQQVALEYGSLAPLAI